MAVDEEVEPAPGLSTSPKDRVDGRRVGDVAMADDSAPSSAASGSTRFFSASP